MNAHLVWMYGGDLAAFVCCAWAFWRGGSAERIGAAIVAIGWTLSIVLTSHAGHGPGIFVVSIDTVMLASFVALAIWSRKLWTFFIAACMLNSETSHFTEHLIRFGMYSYVTAIGLWGGWGLLICLAAGTWGHIRQQKRQRVLNKLT